jgi:antitoxin (DNA-binding transcriptional repressor) of toxin-antitoxin stability system
MASGHCSTSTATAASTPLTDGVLIVRYMFGLRGDALIAQRGRSRAGVPQVVVGDRDLDPDADAVERDGTGAPRDSRRWAHRRVEPFTLSSGRSVHLILYISDPAMSSPRKTAVNVTEMRQNLPALPLAEVKKGREIEVTSRGKVIARIVAGGDPQLDARERLLAARQALPRRRRGQSHRRRVGRRALIVVDTHVLIYDALTPARLSARARKAVDHG